MGRPKKYKTEEERKAAIRESKRVFDASPKGRACHKRYNDRKRAHLAQDKARGYKMVGENKDIIQPVD